MPNTPTNPAYHPTWITIPAGRFRMGSDPRDAAPPFANERPQHQLTLPAYHISRVPITNAQYHTFVTATNYPPPAHWRTDQPPANTANHPVTYVTWHDAQAFCVWAGVRLPSEAEWEKAARGPATPRPTDANTWPWGNDLPTAAHCHFNGQAQGIAPASQSVMPVGQFARGASPYGVLDLAGNVWEWTSSAYRPYPYRAADGREEPHHDHEPRVVRGGSYNHDLRHIRCAARDPIFAGVRDVYIGFRVVTDVVTDIVTEHDPIALSPHALDLDWVLIPAGPFWMGSDPTPRHAAVLPSEMPQHWVELAEYRLAQTPVTNRQYQAFVHATHHPAPTHWPAGILPPRLANHPVTHVDWFDAQAFCSWAGVRLPSEAEWERAAAGPSIDHPPRLYPWGDTQPTAARLNFRRTSKAATTTPVDHYPRGATPDGILDLAGNIWERTNTEYAPYPDHYADHHTDQPEHHREASPGDGPRVLRGGSFLSPSAAYVRAAMRSLSYPTRRREHIGFRVAAPYASTSRAP